MGEIRAEMEKILDKNDWMDDMTRERAKEKLRMMKEYIGYPEEILQEHLLEELYEGLEVGASDHFNNMNRIRKWLTNNAFKQLREKVDSTHWSEPTVVNAFYSLLQNNIHFPAGVLQGTFFGQDR